MLEFDNHIRSIWYKAFTIIVIVLSDSIDSMGFYLSAKQKVISRKTASATAIVVTN